MILTIEFSLSNLAQASTNLKMFFFNLTRDVNKKEAQNHDFNPIFEKKNEERGTLPGIVFAARKFRRKR